MNEASNVQTVDDEKAYVEVVVGGGNCEDENPQKGMSIKYGHTMYVHIALPPPSFNQCL